MKDTNASHNLWHSFCIHPGLRFAEQNDDEKIILAVRAHPISQIHWFLNSFFFVICMVILNVFLPSVLNIGQLFFINFFGVAIIVSYVWLNVLAWHFNVGIITDQRILDVDFHTILYKEVTTAMLSKVEDVTAKTGGFFASFADYGNVFVQTAGSEANIEFMNIPRPSETAKIINSLLNKKQP
ncbi:hypothetical protein GYA28_02540 [Candidatus Roizmanbacteria bacterium]|jgi:hypothetical protein|nr:hypothetical protein [Candidatus Roizmanbacteria bacterium]